jgi:PadR family transcriptional regulator, regulatory protein PadR
MISKALIAASTKPLILGILKGGENYGYQIIQRVKELSGGKIEWADGMLYPVLHRLEKEKLVSTKWEISGENRMRKYYRLTEAGRKELESEIKQWVTVNEVLSNLWKPIPAIEQS